MSTILVKIVMVKSSHGPPAFVPFLSILVVGEIMAPYFNSLAF